MNIFSNSKYLQADDNGLKHVVVVLITACVLLGPSFLLSIVMAHFWPLYLMAGTETLGGVIGAVRFHRASEGSVPDNTQSRASNASSKVAQFPRNRLARAH
jgi:hypothetical protein